VLLSGLSARGICVSSPRSQEAAILCDRDVEIILQRAKERYPQATPRIISDNGPQFIAKDFKEYIRLIGMTYVRTSPFYPQRNGKLERWHKSLKQEVIRPKVPLSLEDAKCLVGEYVSYYNTERLAWCQWLYYAAG
jgi:putative transposase